MLKIRCIAVDDDPIALQQIAAYIERISFLELVGVAADSSGAKELLAQQAVDVVFIDIEMHELKGMEFIRSSGRDPIVVFIAAMDEHALDVFDVDASDYIFKPLSLGAIARVAERIRMHLEHLSLQSETLEKNCCPVIVVKSAGRLLKVRLRDILYIQSIDQFSRFYLMDGQSVETSMNAASVWELLPSADFQVVPSSYIVNRSHLKQLSEEAFELLNGETILLEKSTDAFPSRPMGGLKDLQ